MRYLKKKEIIYFNENTLLTNTPDEINGVREPGELEMLVNAPKEKLFGQELYPTIYEKAAILMINLATKHVFHNGNKRTAFITLDIFMELNGFESNMAFQEGIDFVLWVVQEHEKTADFEKYKLEVVERIKSKYKRKFRNN